MNNIDLVKELMKMTDKEARDGIINALGSSLPKCPFCGSWKIIKDDTTINPKCAHCGASGKNFPPKELKVEELETEIANIYYALETLSLYEEDEGISEQIRNLLDKYLEKVPFACPHCGEDDVNIFDNGGYQAYCKNCGLLGRFENSKSAAIQSWNTRKGV